MYTMLTWFKFTLIFLDHGREIVMILPPRFNETLEFEPTRFIISQTLLFNLMYGSSTISYPCVILKIAFYFKHPNHRSPSPGFGQRCGEPSRRYSDQHQVRMCVCVSQSVRLYVYNTNVQPGSHLVRWVHHSACIAG